MLERILMVSVKEAPGLPGHYTQAEAFTEALHTFL